MNSETMPVRLRRAALVVEMTDGTRMIYELREPVTLTFDGEYDYQPAPPTITVEGELLRGTIWHGDMPTAPTPALSEPRKAIAP